MHTRHRRPRPQAIKSIPRAERALREDLPWVRYFARNLLEAGYLTDDLMQFALEGLEATDHIRFMQAVKMARVRGTTDSDLDMDDWVPGEADSVMRDVSMAVSRGKLRTPPRIIRQLLLDVLQPKVAGVPWTPRIRRLSGQFSLTTEDARILMFLYIREQFPSLNSVIDAVDESPGSRAVAAATRCSVQVVRDAAGPGGTLQRKALTSDARAESRGRRLSTAIQPYVIEYLSGSMKESVVDYFCEQLTESTFASGEFPVAQPSVRIALSLLGSSGRTNLLLHGPPGVGKSELARVFAREAGLRAIRVRRKPDDSAEQYRAAVAAAIQLVDPAADLLVIDEADTLLSGGFSFLMLMGGGTEKGWLNELLDHHDRRVLWITNSIAGIDPSTRRRFDYSLAFHEPGRRDREDQWQRLVTRHSLEDQLGTEAVTQFARTYELGPGAVDRCLAVAARTGADITSVLPEILDRHLQLTRGGARRALSTAGRYDPQLSATDIPLSTITHSTAAFHTTRSAAGTSAAEPGDNVTVLLSGPPGTGKSAYARYLADHLSAPLVEKNASDLMSPWVGQTEANIAAAFSEARDREAVLLIDEADTFLAPRAGAARTYEVSQVNEFLKQMEQHTGILVCCTNLLDRLDSAAMRRFTWKVTYRSPDTAARADLFTRYFPAVPPDAPALDSLKNLTGLTPGDFAAVARKFRYAPEPPEGAEVMSALETELGYREPGRRVVGFGA